MDYRKFSRKILLSALEECCKEAWTDPDAAIEEYLERSLRRDRQERRKQSTPTEDTLKDWLERNG